MSLPATSLVQLLDYEGNLETGFVACLNGAGIQQVFSARSNQTFQSPCVELWVDNGPALEERQKVLSLGQGALNAWTCFEATLHTIVSTNRADKNAEPTHSTRVAQVRQNLMLFFLNQVWTKYEQIQMPYYIRENGAIYNADPNRNIDTTEITWAIRHAINDKAWPANLDVIPPIVPQVTFFIVTDSSDVVVTDSTGKIVTSNEH